MTISSALLLFLILEIISLSIFYFSIKAKKRNRTISRLLLLFAMLPILFLVCFRASSVGTDYELYNWAYNITLDDKPYAHEWLGLFFYVFRILSFIGSYPISIAIINSITIILFFIAAYRNEKSPLLVLAAIFAFCLHLQVFNQFRQSLALALCLLNIQNAREGKTKKFIIIQLLATIAHTTSLIFLPTLFLTKKNFNKKSLIVYALIGVITLMLSPFIMKLLLFTNYGQRYFGGDFDFAAESSTTLLLIRLALFGIVIWLGKISDKRKDVSLLYHMAAICIIIQIVATKSYIFARLTTYYYLAFAILIPELISGIRIKGKQKTIAILIVLLFLLLYKIVYYQTMGPGAGIDNFRFIWS